MPAMEAPGTRSSTMQTVKPEATMRVIDFIWITESQIAYRTSQICDIRCAMLDLRCRPYARAYRKGIRTGPAIE
jgi:hypothetical protein